MGVAASLPELSEWTLHHGDMKEILNILVNPFL